MEKPKVQLPKIQDLYGDVALTHKQNDLNILLNQNPSKKWIKIHPMTKQKYIPIERIEWLLTKVFIRWAVEIKNVQLIANSVMVTVTLHYQDPITNEWLKQDGVGASALQTDKGSSSVDWTKIKSAAVQMGAPAAESYAVKDAADKIGKLFGKDMNRKDVINYDLKSDAKKTEKTSLTPDQYNAAVQFLKDGKTMEELKRYYSFDKETEDKLKLDSNA